MKDFQIEVYDGHEKIFGGPASKFLTDNDNDPDLTEAVEACGLTGCSTYGGGACPDFEIVKKSEEV